MKIVLLYVSLPYSTTTLLLILKVEKEVENHYLFSLPQTLLLHTSLFGLLMTH